VPERSLVLCVGLLPLCGLSREVFDHNNQVNFDQRCKRESTLCLNRQAMATRRRTQIVISKDHRRVATEEEEEARRKEGGNQEEANQRSGRNSIRRKLNLGQTRSKFQPSRLNSKSLLFSIQMHLSLYLKIQPIPLPIMYRCRKLFSLQLAINTPNSKIRERDLVRFVGEVLSTNKAKILDLKKKPITFSTSRTLVVTKRQFADTSEDPLYTSLKRGSCRRSTKLQI